jgi:hypothetical protein
LASATRKTENLNLFWSVYLHIAQQAFRWARLTDRGTGKERPVKYWIRTILFGTTAATSIGVTALVGCALNDTGPSLATSPPAGRVTKVTMELTWPPGAASRVESSAAPALPVATTPPAKYPPIVYTQRPPAPVMTETPPAPRPISAQAIVSAPAASATTGPDLQSDSVTPAATKTVEVARPAYLPDVLPNGKLVENSQPARQVAPVVVTGPASPANPSNSDVRVASLPNSGNFAVMQTSLKQPSGPALNEPPHILSSSAGTATIAADLKEPQQLGSSSTSKAASLPEVSAFSSADSAPPRDAGSGESVTAAEPAFHVVNNKRIKLHFEVKDVGPSGIGGVELWYVHDNREWRKPDATPQKQGPYVVEVDSEGLYGFKLIARNSQGHGEPAPRPGDAPQVWVLVDLTKPAVKISSAKVLQEADGARLEVAWSATDKHLIRRPATLLYAEQPEGPWQPLVANLESSGTLQKKLPLTMPKRFVVRVEALDIAGNVGGDQTREFLELEQTRSRVSILRID